MNYRKYIVGSYVVMASMLFSLQAFALNISPADGKWFRVTEPAQEGHSECEKGGKTWKFTVSWKPIIYQGKPWKTYTVGGYKCAQKVPVRCSKGRCSAEIGSCALPAARTWASIVADYGTDNGGVRVSGFEAHPLCK